jgi:hypothetical protein
MDEFYRLNMCMEMLNAKLPWSHKTKYVCYI